jgi:hypothetical protein
VTPVEVGPAIARLLMITAGALSEDDAVEVERALQAFGGDAEALRELARRLALAVADKLPNGATVVLADDADFLALRMVQATEVFGGDALADLCADLPEPLLPPVAVSLLAFWANACRQVAARDLARLHVPAHAPEGIT